MSNLSFIPYTGDGVTKTYGISFTGEDMGYLRSSDIYAFVDDEEVASYVDPASPHIVNLLEAPDAGTSIVIRRIMPEERPFVDFSRGNNFGYRQVNYTFLQQLYLTHEILDGFKGDSYYEKQDYNMGYHRITNVLNAVEDTDAVNKGQVEEILADTLEGLLEDYKNELLNLISVNVLEVPPFNGNTITLESPVTNIQVEVNGRILPPSTFSLSTDGLTITLESAVREFDYVVVKSVFLPLEKLNSKNIYLGDYGITSEGSDIDAIKLKTAVDVANLTGKAVIGGRDLKLTLKGSEVITVKTDINFKGAEVDISEWGGKFKFVNSEWTTYEQGSPVFDALYNTGVLSSDKVDAWSGLSEIDNSYIKVNSSNYHYTYRNIDITHTEFNVCTTRGKCLSLFNDLDTTNLTSIEVLKIPEKDYRFGNMQLVVGSKSVGDGFLDVDDSGCLDIRDIRISSNDEIFTAINPNFIDLFNSVYLRINRVIFNKPFQADTPDRFAYGIRMEYCYDVRHFKLEGYGEGWGILGSNSSRNIYYDHCTVNRVDFHKPLVELLQLTNCKIGSWGMLLTTIGDVKIDKCQFINNSTDYFGQRAYIAANDSAGGFANGDLIITNSKFKSADNQLMLLYVNKANDTGGIRYPSPIAKQCWNSIKVFNCDFGKGYETALMPGIEDDNGMRWPSEVVFRDCTGDCLISRNLVKSLPRYVITNDEADLNKPHNLFITIDNVETVYDKELYIGDRRDQNFKIKLNLNNIKATHNDVGNSGVTLSLVFGGDATITNSLVEGFNFFETNTHYKPLNINIDTTTVNYIGRIYDEMFKNPAPRSSITASNSTFIGTVDSVKGLARITSVGSKMKVSNSPNFYNSVAVTDSNSVTITNGSSGTKTAIVPVNWEQGAEIGISVGAGGAYRLPVTLKDEGVEYTIPIGTGTIGLVRNGSSIQLYNRVGAATNVYFYYVNKLI